MEYLFIILLLLVGFLSLMSSVNTLKSQFSRISLKLDKIAKQVGVEEPDIDSELRALIVQGKKVEAIKKLREFTGLGLKEAKEYVDNL